MQVVTAKVTHIGLDYATIELSTVSSEPETISNIEVPLQVGQWLEKVGAYEKVEAHDTDQSEGRQ